MNVNFKIRLIIPIIAIFLLSGKIMADGANQPNSAELQQRVLKQTDELDLIFELLSEAASNGKFNDKYKKDSLANFGKMRNIINNAKNTDSANLFRILNTNEVMINNLEFMTKHNFNAIPNINSTQIVRRLPRSLSAAEVKEKLQVNEQKLKIIQKKFKSIGLSAINILTRKSEKIIKRFKINRIAPYALMALYILYVTRKAQIERVTPYLPQILATPINSIKELMGTALFTKREDSTAPEVKDRYQGEDGPLNSLQQLIQTGGFFQIEIEPILKWAPAAFLFGFIKKDLEDVTKAFKKKLNYLFSKLKNKSVDENTVFSKPSFNPESLDLLEITEFKNIKNYFKYKDLFNLADHPIDRSYVFLGQQISGYYLADILCANLSKDLESDCRIVQLHASDFVPSKPIEDATFDENDILSATVADTKKHDICLVVIDDIDWIYAQKERTVARLNKFLDDISKKSNTIVLALTNSPQLLQPNARNTLIKLNIENLNYKQRIKFIKAQLRADHTSQDLAIETIAQQTEDYTIADLKSIVQNAYTISYSEHKPLNKEHVALSLEQMAKKHK